MENIDVCCDVMDLVIDVVKQAFPDPDKVLE